MLTRRLVRVLTRALLTAALLLTPALRAASEQKQSFDLPGGEAPAMLRQFAERSGREVLFAAESVRGVRTNPVRGEFTPREALDRMLAGTALVAVLDERSGALAVSRREVAAPPAPVEKKPRAADPAAAADTGDVVKLDAFQVSTTVGSYAETTNSAAGKIPIDMKDLAATLQVLNANFIGDKLATSLEDLYPYVVGMTRESPAGAGFTLRGYTNGYTNTMINNLTTDGLPGGASRFGSPTTANVERVEVLKGPNSVLYGALNPGGMINVVTKQPSLKREGSVFLAAGAYAGDQGKNGTGFKATLDTTGPLDAGKHWLYRFVAAYEDAPSWRQFDWTRNYYYFPSLTYRLDENTEATVKVELHREHRFAIQDQALVAPGSLAANVPADHSLVYQDRNNTAYDRGDVYNFSARHQFASKWVAKFSTRAVHHVDGRRLLENRSVNLASPLANSTITQRLRDTWNRRRYAYHDFNVYGDVGPEDFKHTLLFGVNAGYEMANFTRWIFQNVTGPAINVYAPIHDLRTYPTVNSTTGTAPTQIGVSKYYNYGAYVSDQIKLGKHWRVSLGVHTEKYDTKYTDTAVLVANGRFVNPGQAGHPRATVPSVGLVYQPRDNLSVYASYAESFKPTPPNSVALGAPQPGPERAEQKEVGLKADFLEHKLELLVSVYDIERKDVVEAVPNAFDPATGIQIYRSLSNKSNGAEVSINFQPLRHWQTQVGYAYNDARVSQSAALTLMNARLANAPQHSGNLWTRYNVPTGALRGFGVGFGLVYTGKQNLVLDNRASAQLAIPSATRADLAFYYKLRRYELALNVNNLTDKSYIAGGDANTDVVPGAPRKITASVRYSF